MDWADEGIVLSVRPHGETSAIVEIFTRGRGRHMGLVRGGRSRTRRPVLQPGNHVDAVWRARLEDHLGQFTVHLREDRRHIGDDDISALKSELDCPLNLEMAATAEMLDIALNHRPNACCIVPEKRAELTTAGGLDVAGQIAAIVPFVDQLRSAGIRVSLFIDPDNHQIEAAKACAADVIEIHTGSYCEAAFARDDAGYARELDRIVHGAAFASELGLEVHAGHGLTYDTTGAIASIAEIVELNIGHFLVGEAIFSGLDSSVRRMRALMDQARANVSGARSA